MLDDPFAEWQVDEADFPRGGDSEEKLRFLVRYAVLAPSSHNTQPWLFRVAGDRLQLIADRSRRLPVVDPDDRALVISCGAALGILRAALRYFGYSGAFDLLPSNAAPDHLADVRLGKAHQPDEADRRRFKAITRRRSTRLPFADEPLPAGLPECLANLAAEDGVRVIVITDASKRLEVAKLVAEGDRDQFDDPAFRRELGSWVHSRRSASRDGMSGSAFGMPDLLSPAGGLVIRALNMGGSIAAKDEKVAAAAPALVLVATASDEPADWLRAGIAHATMLLEIAGHGLTAAYLNQPIEVEALRPRLRLATATNGIPQLLMRIGRGAEIAPAVRRHVDQVLLP